ncbi:hypothetical protein [Aliivibrio fischeri]|uniref:hypothetical protein n=1 Tax=Aliivibrio fischeri TaxID=668 RepID=UPI0012D980F1|nr:hypothetical protein [Aliivibrio fischeri]MUK28432.1 hypothetical protein [Aliivibrio fischeri]MUK35941.1 hypothetical protein [Aliivibrio fischeri]
MNKKYVITWIGVVSGILTILLSFGNPLAIKPKLEAYVSSSDYLINPSNNENTVEFDLMNRYLTTVTLANTGDKVANEVHINFKTSYEEAVVISGSKKVVYKDSSPIYIESLQPDDVITVYFWSYYPAISSDLSDSLIISSPDSDLASLRSDIKGTGLIWYFNEYGIYMVGFVVWLLLISLPNKSDTPKKQSQQNNEEPNNLNVQKDELVALTYAWEIGLITDAEFKERGRNILDKK